ncbi:MAG: myxococcus cysteine-rich repeat containing protein [Myxococcota bacterium]
MRTRAYFRSPLALLLLVGCARDDSLILAAPVTHAAVLWTDDQGSLVLSGGLRAPPVELDFGAGPTQNAWILAFDRPWGDRPEPDAEVLATSPIRASERVCDRLPPPTSVHAFDASGPRVASFPIANLSTAWSAAACCGNGELDEGEACDDGNSTSGDGCSASCAVEGLGEVEPNDTPATANPLTLIAGSATISGSLRETGDVDSYRFHAPADSTLTASIEPDGCALHVSLVLSPSSNFDCKISPDRDPTFAIGLSGDYVLTVRPQAPIPFYRLRVRLGP